MTPRIKIPDSHGFEVYVYFGDSEHGKPHCHVYRAEHAAVIALGDEQTRPSFLENNLKPKDARIAMRLVEKNQAALLRAWREGQER